MRKILTAALGILCGIAIIVMAFQFNSMSYEAGSLRLEALSSSGVDPVLADDSYTASYERDYYYGGDAYTGIQQAAAQAANNILALEETLNQTNNDLAAINRNIKTTNSNLATINNNLIKALQSQAEEQGSATAASIRSVGKLGFFLLLAIGMLTVVKYLGQLLDGIAEAGKSKAAVAECAPAPAVEAPAANEATEV